MYILRKYKDGTIKYPYTIAELVSEEQISRPSLGFTKEQLAKYGVYEVEEVNYPTNGVFPSYQIARSEPIEAEDGTWTQEITLEPRVIENLLYNDGSIAELARDRELRLCKEFTSNLIYETFESEEATNVAIDGISYFADTESASKIYFAKELAVSNGATSMEITDINRLSNTLTIAKVEELLKLIGSKTQTSFLSKQDRLSRLENANNVSAVELIKDEMV